MIRSAILLLWIICARVQAQSNTSAVITSEAYWNLTTIPAPGQATLKVGTNGAPDPTSLQNQVIMQQNGLHNTALLSITNGVENRLQVTQSNGYNYTDITLSGNNNSVLLNQTGANNSVSLGLTGVNNRFSLTQDGGDRLQIQGLQQANTRLDIAQGSGNNSLTIDNTSLFRGASGSGIPNLRIEQSGGAAAMIQNGRIFGN